MPIYKVTSPQPAQPVVNPKFKGFEVSASVEATHDQNGQDAMPVHAGRAQNIKNTSRGHELSSPEAQHEIEKRKVSTRRETVVEREVREQLKREAEHDLRLSKTFSSPEDSALMKVDILVSSSMEQNGGKHEQCDHVVPDHVGQPKGKVVVDERTMSSPEVFCTTMTTSTCGGGLTTSKNTRSGANRILQELQEQAAREEELWRRWKGTGSQSDAHLEDGKLDQPGSNNKTYPNVEGNLDVVDSGNLGLEERRPSLPDALAEVPYGKTALRGEISLRGQSSKSSAGQRRNSSKVQPFEDVDRIQSEVLIPYEPQNETPIDREIRIHREREEALRLDRGILFSVSNCSPEIEVEVVRPRQVDEGGSSALPSSSLGLSMQKFAESRLRCELEREKKREIDLLKEGKIKVLSEQRTPEAVRYVEMISPEKEELRDQSRRRSAEKKELSSKEMALIEMASKEIATKGMSSKGVTVKEMAPKVHLNSVRVEVRTDQVDGGKNTLNTQLDRTSDTTKSGKHLEPTGNEERVGKRSKANTKSPNSYTMDDVRKILLTAAEQRIEEEIAESKKRELELREQRRYHVTSEFPHQPEPEDDSRNNAHAPNSASQKEAGQYPPQPIRDGLDSVDCGYDRHQQPPDGQGGSRRESRRLTLIDQWERGIIQTADQSYP